MAHLRRARLAADDPDRICRNCGNDHRRASDFCSARCVQAYRYRHSVKICAVLADPAVEAAFTERAPTNFWGVWQAARDCSACELRLKRTGVAAGEFEPSPLAMAGA